MSIKTFGDPGNFAIQYQPCPDNYNYKPSAQMAICHMVINNHLIGNPTEECYLPTWLFSLNAHHFPIDETIDSYLIYFYVRNDRITFLIEDDSIVKDNSDRSFQFIFKTLDLNLFIRTIDEMTYFLLEQYPYLQQNVSDRKFPLK
jgi:hypothetical protein